MECVSPSWLTLLVQFVTAVGVAVSAFFSYRAVKASETNGVSAREFAQGQTISKCFDVYYEISDSLAKGLIGGGTYFEKIWGLHFTEFHLWKRKLLPDDVYCVWLMLRCREYSSNAHELSMSEKEGWEHAQQRIGDQQFIAFVNRLLGLSGQDDIQKFIASFRVGIGKQ